MSYFRPQQAGNIGPRTIHRLPDSTSLLSQNAGQVTSRGIKMWAGSFLAVHSAPLNRMVMAFNPHVGIVGNTEPGCRES